MPFCSWTSSLLSGSNQTITDMSCSHLNLVLDTRLDGKINENLQQAPTRVCLGLSSQGNGGFTAHWALQWQGIGRGLTILDNGLSKADSIGREFLSNSVRTTSKRTDKGWSTKMDCIATEAKVEAATGAARQIPERLNVAIATIVFTVYMGFFFGVSLLAGSHFWLFVLVDLGFLISTPTIGGFVRFADAGPSSPPWMPADAPVRCPDSILFVDFFCAAQPQPIHAETHTKTVL